MYLCRRKKINYMVKTTLCEEGDRVVMYFEGRIDTPEAIKVDKEMKVLHDYHDKEIVLDLTDLKYVCSAGLRLFLSLLHESRDKNNTVIVTGLSPYVRRVFDETGFTRLFKLDEP